MHGLRAEEEEGREGGGETWAGGGLSVLLIPGGTLQNKLLL